MKRKELITKLKDNNETIWDVIVIGGGATGLGVALDSICRGYKTLLLERSDFAQSTSSRSTKLMHGGVRYLAQGDIFLVMEALHERSRMHQNAPHITCNQEFTIPVYSWWDALKYGIGLKLYDLLAGGLSMGKSKYIGKKETLKRLPLLQKKGLKGGVIYHDGQFDDARFALVLAQTCAEKGAVPLNYFKVTSLQKDKDGKVNGVCSEDAVSGEKYTFKSKVVINATGVFADDILAMDKKNAAKTIRPSQGVHLVLDNSFLQSDSALMIPKTSDGRVLFAIPWYDKVVIGTTDTPIDEIEIEPKTTEDEVKFILETAGRFLTRKPNEDDILCAFAGLRPLAAPIKNNEKTKEISRRHKITISDSGLVSILGGKWTIYRRMAEDTMDKVIKLGMLKKTDGNTKNLRLYGSEYHNPKDRLRIYGHHAKDIKQAIHEYPESGIQMHPAFPFCEAEIAWICKNEMPVKLEDILSRRTRSLVLDAKASIAIAYKVVKIMATEFGYDKEWQVKQVEDYEKLVKTYLHIPVNQADDLIDTQIDAKHAEKTAS